MFCCSTLFPAKVGPESLVRILVSWGLIEILAFGDVSKRWIISSKGVNSTKYFATPGLFLRLIEGGFVAYLLCISEREYKAWLPGSAVPEASQLTYADALSAACGYSGFDNKVKKSWKALGFFKPVFCSRLNHFVVGTPLNTTEKFDITKEGQRLMPPPMQMSEAINIPINIPILKKRIGTYFDGDDDVDDDKNVEDNDEQQISKPTDQLRGSVSFLLALFSCL
jgi:hypothetical protein